MAERDRFELDLAAALRAYLEDAPTQVRPTELARHLATTYPRGRTAFGPWRLGPTRACAWVLLLLAGLLAAMVGGMLIVGSQPVRKSRPWCRPSARCSLSARLDARHAGAGRPGPAVRRRLDGRDGLR